MISVPRWISTTVLAATAFTAGAQTCMPLNPAWPGIQGGNFINLRTPGGHSWASAAANAWNTTCDVEQLPFLDVSTGTQSGLLNIDIVYQAGRNPNLNNSGTGCGWTSLQLSGSSGAILSGAITVFEQETNGAACSDPEYVLRHELGHLFGLDDTFETSCQGHLMYGRYQSTSPTVTESLCAAADSQWATDWESPDPCDHPDPPQGCDDGQSSSPILLDLDGNGFQLAGLDHAVAFDIDGDGMPDLLSWTTGATADAFLALDRNRNGRIDSGQELFGNWTPLSDGSLANNGYEALGESDLAFLGGNGNGALDAGDAIYSRLILWIDWNHDSNSQPHEILTLAEVGVTRIELDYWESRRRDRHGNELRYRSRAWIRRGAVERPIWSADVFLQRR